MMSDTNVAQLNYFAIMWTDVLVCCQRKKTAFVAIRYIAPVSFKLHDQTSVCYTYCADTRFGTELIGD